MLFFLAHLPVLFQFISANQFNINTVMIPEAIFGTI